MLIIPIGIYLRVLYRQYYLEATWKFLFLKDI